MTDISIPPGVHLCADATARIASNLILRGRGVITMSKHARIEENVVIDFGNSGRGTVVLHSRSKIKVGVVLRCYNGAIEVGEHTSLGDYCVVYGHGGVRIGAHVGVGPHCTIAASQHISTSRDIPIRYQGETAKGIRIEDDVWIGSGARILDDLTVRSGCVIGAGSVVTRSTPPNYICMGTPCTPIRPRH